MRKTVFVVAAIGVLAVSALFASNMGFKLNYLLAAQGEATPDGNSNAGFNKLALPFNRQTGLNTADQLLQDIGSANVVSISRLDRTTDLLQTHNRVDGSGGVNNFALTAGEGYIVRMDSTGGGTNYIVVGSHDPGLTVVLAGTGEAVPGGGNSNGGFNDFAFPYHGTASDALTLSNDIGSTAVVGISRLNRATDLLVTFNPLSGTTNFSLTPGESYIVRINAGVTVNYTPSHY